MCLGRTKERLAPPGVTMIRKGEAGTGDVVHAVTPAVVKDTRCLTVFGEDELCARRRNCGAPYELVCTVREPASFRFPTFLPAISRRLMQPWSAKSSTTVAAKEG